VVVISMATTAQIKKIHALKSELRLDDEAYRSMLEAYVSPEGTPVWSSKDLSYYQASSLINSMEMIIRRTPGLRSLFHIRRFDRIPRKQIAKVIKSLRIMTRRAFPSKEN
jgi:hypothetical protein